MLQIKLLVGGLLASAVALVIFVASLAALSTDVNVLNLALSNPKDAFSPTLSTLSGSDLDLETDMTGTITGTLNLTGTDKIAEAITKYFSGTLTVSDVVGLHNQGWGFGEIFKLYFLAQESGMTPDQIKALRDSGMGWGEIAKSLDLSPGNKGKNLGAAVSGHGIGGQQTTDSTEDDNSHGNPHGGPPGKSESGPPGKSESGPPGKGNGKGK